MSEENFDGEEVMVSGWGSHGTNGPVVERLAKATGLKVLSNDACQAWHGMPVGPSKICAERINGSVCSGDSGGDLCLN